MLCGGRWYKYYILVIIIVSCCTRTLGKSTTRTTFEVRETFWRVGFPACCRAVCSGMIDFVFFEILCRPLDMHRRRVDGEEEEEEEEAPLSDREVRARVALNS